MKTEKPLKLSIFLVLLLFVGIRIVSAEVKSLKIGLISGLTGAAAKWGRYQNMGVTLAQEELKAKGIDIKIILEDSQTSGARAISALNKLTEFDHVDAIICDDFGIVTAPLIPIVNKRKIFLVASGLPHDRFCTADGFAFSVTSQFARAREAFDRFFILNPQVKKIGLVVFDDQDWGQTYQTIWNDLAKAHGIEVVDTFLNNEWTPDFKSALTRMLPKKPDAIFLAHEPESFFKAVGQLQYKGLVISANSVFEMVAEKLTKRPEIEGVYVADPEISVEFKEKFFKRFNLPPILEAYSGYEALITTAQAFTNNWQHPELGIKQVKYKGVAGQIDFTGPSCAGNITDWALFRFQRGEAVKQ